MRAMKYIIIFFATAVCIAYAGAQGNSIKFETPDGKQIQAAVKDYRGGKVVLDYNGRRVTLNEDYFPEKTLLQIREIMSVKNVPNLKVKERVSTRSDVEKSVVWNNNQTKNVTRKKEYEIAVTSTSPYERDVFVFWLVLKGDVDDMPPEIVGVNHQDQDRAYSYYGTKKYTVDNGGLKSDGQVVPVGNGKSYETTVTESASSVTEKMAYYGSGSTTKSGTDKINVAVLVLGKDGKLLRDYSSNGTLLKELKTKRLREIQKAALAAFGVASDSDDD